MTWTPLDDDHPPEAQHSSLWKYSKAFATRFPDVCGLLLLIAGNLFILGPIAGYGLEPARQYDDYYLFAHPVLIRCDAFCLGLATSQLALVTLWGCYSRRLLLSRFAVWFCIAIVFAATLVSLISGSNSLATLTVLFVTLSLGVVLTSYLMPRRKWRLQVPDNFATFADSKRQFGIGELVLLLTIVACLCALVAALEETTGFYSFNYLVYALSQPGFFRGLLQVGLVGAGTNLLLRSWLASGPLFGIVTTLLVTAGLVGLFELGDEFDRSVLFNPYVPQSSLGTNVWLGLHVLIQSAVLLAIWCLGFRVERLSSERERGHLLGIRMIAWRRLGFGLIIASCVGALGYYGPAYYRNWKLAKSVAHIGDIMHDSSGRTTYILREPLDEQAFKALRDHPVVTHVMVVSKDVTQVNQSFQRLKKLTWVGGFDFYNSSLTLEQEIVLKAQLPKAAIRRF